MMGPVAYEVGASNPLSFESAAVGADNAKLIRVSTCPCKSLHLACIKPARIFLSGQPNFEKAAPQQRCAELVRGLIVDHMPEIGELTPVTLLIVFGRVTLLIIKPITSISLLLPRDLVSESLLFMNMRKKHITQPCADQFPPLFRTQPRLSTSVVALPSPLFFSLNPSRCRAYRKHFTMCAFDELSVSQSAAHPILLQYEVRITQHEENVSDSSSAKVSTLFTFANFARLDTDDTF